jgi:protein-tyrosine-phosphatase
VLREWLIPDPLGHSMAFFKDVRNQIETKIAELFEEIGLGQKQD